MRYFIDTEFIERPCTIDLISLAIVAQNGRELYLVSTEFDGTQANEFVRKHVIPNLAHPNNQSMPYVSRATMRERVLEFIGTDATPEFWGYFADYDWVGFCWLFGGMSDLPKGWPYYCGDLRQALDAAGPTSVQQDLSDHNALSDARWVAATFRKYIS